MLFRLIIRSLQKKYDMVFVVPFCTIDFLKPGYLDDRGSTGIGTPGDGAGRENGSEDCAYD